MTGKKIAVLIICASTVSGVIAFTLGKNYAEASDSLQVPSNTAMVATSTDKLPESGDSERDSGPETTIVSVTSEVDRIAGQSKFEAINELTGDLKQHLVILGNLGLVLRETSTYSDPSDTTSLIDTLKPGFWYPMRPSDKKGWLAVMGTPGEWNYAKQSAIEFHSDRSWWSTYEFGARYAVLPRNTESDNPYLNLPRVNPPTFNPDVHPDLTSEIDEVRSNFDDLENELVKLKRQMDDFSDGYSNWRDVVSESESQLRRVMFALPDLESAISDLESAGR